MLRESRSLRVWLRRLTLVFLVRQRALSTSCRASELTSVNNAGTSHEMPVAFAETTPEELESIVQVVRTEPGSQSRS